jgi:hypothetical protein
VLSGTPQIGTWPSAAGLGSDDENTLRVPDALAQIVVTRQEWVDGVGEVFDAMGREQLGRIFGLPERSIYEGLELGSRGADEPYGWGRHVRCRPPNAGVEAMDVDKWRCPVQLRGNFTLLLS